MFSDRALERVSSLYFASGERISVPVELVYNLMIGWFYIAGTTCAIWFLGGFQGDDAAYTTVLIGSVLFVVVASVAALL